MGMASLFGGAPSGSSDAEPVKREDGEYIDGYKVADAEDMEWLANLLG